MCGIAGVYGYNLNREDEDLVLEMIKSLEHRGPDNIGIYVSKNCILGHARLSILDLSPNANQPMVDSKEEVVVTFNGEIYNFKELRKNLEKKYSFKTTNSDTETIIYAYKEWGIDFIKYLNGMFAIGLYDKKRNKLFLIRDRFGKKPIYYVIKDNKIYFASEIKAFLKSNLIKKSINIEGLYHFLTYLTVYPPQTLFKDVYKVKASHYLEIDSNGGKLIINERKYYDISNALNDPDDSPLNVILKNFDRLLKDSIYLRNISDVDVAVSLSGGLDSSLNLVLSKAINSNIHAINITLEDDNIDDISESIYAKRLAYDLDVPYIQVKLKPDDFIKIIDELSNKHYDTPICWPDMALMYAISKTLKEKGIKVVIIGEGGDELTAYPQYFKMLKIYNLYNRFKPVVQLVNPILSKLVLFGDYIVDNELIVYRNIYGFPEKLKRNLLKKKLIQNEKISNSYYINKKLANEITVNSKDKYIRQILNIEYKFRLPELLLPRIDYSTMLNSVEARAPFLDYKLVEYTIRTSFFERNKGEFRRLQKEVAKKYLPKYIINKPKMGFGQEFWTVIKNNIFDYTLEILENKDSHIYNYLSYYELNSIFGKYHKKSKSLVWIIYTLEKFLEKLDFL